MNSKKMREHLLLAVHRVIRALARTLLRAGIRFEDFAAVARGVYIESAIRDFRYPSTPSRERIAVTTGLTRSQIDAYVDDDGKQIDGDPALMFLVAEVLRTWHTNPRFLGPYGIPLELRLDMPEDRSFRSVVASVDPRADARIVLSELLRTGAVVRSGEQHFRAVSRSVMLDEGVSEQAIEYQANGLSRLAATLEYNMNPENADRRLDRRARADQGLAVGLLPAFEEYSRDQANDFLLDLDNWLTSQIETQSGDGERLDAGVGVFFFVAPISDAHSTNRRKVPKDAS